MKPLGRFEPRTDRGRHRLDPAVAGQNPGSVERVAERRATPVLEASPHNRATVFRASERHVQQPEALGHLLSAGLLFPFALTRADVEKWAALFVVPVDPSGCGLEGRRPQEGCHTNPYSSPFAWWMVVTLTRRSSLSRRSCAASDAISARATVSLRMR